jgi:hypothetical protein
MSDEHEEVNNLVTVLTTKVITCQDNFRLSAISNAIYGLKRMTSDRIEVRKLIQALSPKVRLTNHFITNNVFETTMSFIP